MALLAGTAFLPRIARAREYTSAAEVLDTIDRLSAEVDAALAVIAKGLPAVLPFAESVRADHVRERADRAAIRARRRLRAAIGPAPVTRPSRSLDALRTLQQELVHAHAEGLPALDDPAAVQVLARHLVEASRRLTVIDLWLELEEQRGG